MTYNDRQMDSTSFINLTLHLNFYSVGHMQ